MSVPNFSFLACLEVARLVWLARLARLDHPIPQGFSSLVLKPYVKGVTHSEKLGWWNILMVECVTLF